MIGISSAFLSMYYNRLSDWRSVPVCQNQFYGASPKWPCVEQDGKSCLLTWATADCV